MADHFKLQVITPDRKFYQGDVQMVELTTTEGQIGVYARHIPLTAVVAPGILTIHEDWEKKTAALMSGFVQIMPEEVTIMAEVVEWPDEIDENRAKEAKTRAERRIQSHDAEMDVARAELALKRALVRLEARQ